MTRRWSWVLAVPALLATPGTVQAQADGDTTPPCDALDAHREFDFWLGEWEVVDESGQPLGTNSITRPEQECMLLEKWESAEGTRGTSINYYDPATGQWVQYWVTATSLLDLAGGFENGAMRMQGHARQVDGSGGITLVRGTWTPLEDGRVRQLFERRDGPDERWEVVFEGYYVRKDSTEGRGR